MWSPQGKSGHCFMSPGGEMQRSLCVYCGMSQSELDAIRFSSSNSGQNYPNCTQAPPMPMYPVYDHAVVGSGSSLSSMSSNRLSSNALGVKNTSGMGTFNGLMSKQFPTNLEHRKRQFMPASPTGTIEKNVPTGTVLILGQDLTQADHPKTMYAVAKMVKEGNGFLG